MAKGRNHKWQDNDELKKTAERMSEGSATTADLLEKMFAWVTDHIRVHNKNKKISEMVKWFYMSCSPYAKEGMPVFETQLEDYYKTAKMFAVLSQHTVSSCRFAAKLS